ncbi:MAG: MATE family efflux transporter [Rhodobacteraceae bacterium]|nr:MATE family efflux transporter [Paracoccaceae bacterium]MCY4196548.1 MATE family efflux transporter [Paracoccaceae bacterium]
MSLARSDNISHRRVLNIAIPIAVSNATVPLLGAVDTGVVGQMGAAAPIGAVGIGAIILTTLYWFFGFLRLGISGLTAQARGESDPYEVTALLVRGLLIAFVAGILLAFLQKPLLTVSFLVAPASDVVESLAWDYAAIRILSAPAAISMFAITGWLIAHEKTRSVLLIQVVTNGINIVLDLVFVLVLDLGVRGVAVATVTAEISGLVLALYLCRGAFQHGYWCHWSVVFDRERLTRLAVLNSDIVIRNILIEAIFVSLLFLAADLGDVTLAANQILLQFLLLTAHALDGFAFAAEALVGLAVGARRRSELRRSVVLTSVWSGILALVMSFGLVIFGSLGINIMTTAADVRAESLAYLPWIVAAPLVGAPAWILDGIFVGATRGRDMRNSMLVSAALYGLCVIILVPMVGNHGLWAGILLSFAARAVTLGRKYRAVEDDANN